MEREVQAFQPVSEDELGSFLRDEIMPLANQLGGENWSCVDTTIRLITDDGSSSRVTFYARRGGDDSDDELLAQYRLTSSTSEQLDSEWDEEAVKRLMGVQLMETALEYEDTYWCEYYDEDGNEVDDVADAVLIQYRGSIETKYEYDFKCFSDDATVSGMKKMFLNFIDEDDDEVNTEIGYQQEVTNFETDVRDLEALLNGSEVCMDTETFESSLTSVTHQDIDEARMIMRRFGFNL